MATRESTKNVSVCRNRDYSSTFVWTSPLNEDVYKFYLQARENPAKGYMKRMKHLWDEKYPMFANLTEKHLRQQATFVQSKQEKIRATNEQRNNAVGETPPDTINSNEETARAHDDERNPVEENTVTNGNEENTQEQVNCCDEFNENDLSTTREAFLKHFTKTHSIELHQREYRTRVNCKIDKEALLLMNSVIKGFMENKETITFWDINCIQYASAVTLLEQSGNLQKCMKQARKPQRRGWVIEAENQINAVRRKLSHITLVLQCGDRNQLTTKQKQIANKLRKLYGNLKEATLNAKRSKLKHDLKVCNTKLRDNLKKAERSRINRLFSTNQKQVFRSWRGKQVEIRNPPPIECIRTFWADIWEKRTPVNLENEWYEELRKSYCTNATGKDYQITEDTFNEVMSKMANNKAPGTDNVVSFWIKRMTALHPYLLVLLQRTYEGEIELPEWLVTSLTNLLAKNTETQFAKNYRPIACQNNTYKLYTGILNHLLYDHCVTNSILSVEQAGGKKGYWGCTDQLLINKMIMDEVRSNRRNLFTMWFDYKKAFDSVPHEWLLLSLRLAKVPEKLLSAISQLTKQWATKIILKSGEETSSTDKIHYSTGILQGDCLSLLLFILSVNPLSHLLNQKCDGYPIGPTGERSSTINHLLFVDDLKTYAKDRKTAEEQLKVITQFTNDIGMKFGTDKCAYLNIERGERKSLGENITVNGLGMSELKDTDSYKYLGCDEDVAYRGALNKDRVVQEYLNRVRKIWKSELFGKNKIIAHNTFAVPVLILTFGILNWTKDEVEAIDVKTRKCLTMSGNFHRNSSVDRLYTNRNDGGRGMTSVFDMFVSRIISTAKHLILMRDSHRYLRLVYDHEKDRLLRAARTLCDSINVEDLENKEAKMLSTHVKNALKENHKNGFADKPQHGFVARKQQDTEDHNKDMSNAWLRVNGIPSHTEGYICAIQEQEIRTRALIAKREQPDNTAYNSQCRYCNSKKEDIFHLLCSCGKLSASLYLPVRHDEVARTLYNALIHQEHPDHPYILPPEIWTSQVLELWWDKRIKVVPPVPNNKPDIVLWNKETKICSIIDVCVPLDQNIHKEEDTKNDRYTRLIVGLQRLYPEYTYQILPIVLGATGLITNSLVDNLNHLFDKKATTRLIPKLQQKALIGSMRIMKSAMSMKPS